MMKTIRWVVLMAGLLLTPIFSSHAQEAPKGYEITASEARLNALPGVRHHGPVLEIPLLEGASFDDLVMTLEGEMPEANLNIVARQDMGNAITARTGIPMPRYVIFNICNLEVGRKIITVEPAFGAFMPCKVVLYEESMDGRVWAITYKPAFAIPYFPNLPQEALDAAREVGDKMFDILFLMATEG
ncbi:MAG: DUF302 domain-containing protein [Magnetococcales bacterium]|nr:DUF302 domain-containing protein [Magnetococcales bacterium]